MDSRVIMAIQNLFFKAGYDRGITRLSFCQGSGNNRSYVVQTEDRKFLAKFYFTDARQRMEREWQFINYAASCGISCVPCPVVCGPDENLAIYEFIDGQKPLEKEISLSDIQQASNFFKALNKPTVKVGKLLPFASEACFKIDGHFSIIETRLLRLNSVKSLYPCQHDFQKLIENLLSQWDIFKKILTSKALQKKLSLYEQLNKRCWCISPSDFGFHNSIRQSNGKLYFIDFEYAGWDDPCKMIVDFLLQPEIPIKHEYHEFFLSDVLDGFYDSEKIAIRVQILYPILAFKWSCIVLNCFMLEWVEVNAFSNPMRDIEELKMNRLKKSVNYLEQAMWMADKL